MRLKSWHVARAGLELSVYPGLALNLQSSCLSLPKAGMRGLCHFAWECVPAADAAESCPPAIHFFWSVCLVWRLFLTPAQVERPKGHPGGTKLPPCPEGAAPGGALCRLAGCGPRGRVSELCPCSRWKGKDLWACLGSLESLGLVGTQGHELSCACSPHTGLPAPPGQPRCLLQAVPGKTEMGPWQGPPFRGGHW